MEKTIRLFDETPYLKDFEATVVLIDPESDDNSSHAVIVLDQTAFFPESGGQSADTGFIGGLRVIDTKENEGIIYHTVDYSKCDLPVVSSVVSCSIDWERRFSNMQQHTGEHIYSGIVHSEFGYDNVGFHLSDDNVTMDYNGKMSWEDAIRIEHLANDAVFRNLPVNISFPSSKELSELDYRSKLDESQMDDIRIVEIPGIDICACCATHVSSTAQVGLIKVVDLINHRGGVRLHILCGKRALLDFDNKHDIIRGVGNALSSPIEEIISRVEKLKTDYKSLEYDLKAFYAASLKSSLSSIDENTIHPSVFTKISDEHIIRDAVNSLMASHNGYCMVFSGDDENGYRFIIGSTSYDCKSLCQSLKPLLNLNGGGSPKMVQGQIKNAKDEIENALRKEISDYQ